MAGTAFNDIGKFAVDIDNNGIVLADMRCDVENNAHVAVFKGLNDRWGFRIRIGNAGLSHKGSVFAGNKRGLLMVARCDRRR